MSPCSQYHNILNHDPVSWYVLYHQILAGTQPWLTVAPYLAYQYSNPLPESKMHIPQNVNHFFL